MEKKIALLASYIFHPIIVLPVFLLWFLNWKNVDNGMITFWFASTFLTAVVPYLIAGYLASKHSKHIHELISPEDKRRILMPSFMFFSMAFLYFVLEAPKYEALFRIPLVLVLGFYLGLYLTMAFILVIYSLKLNLSLHIIVWGNVFGFFYFWIYMPGYVRLLPYLFVTLVILLVVGVSRYLLDAHKRWEIYLSFITGAFISAEVVYLLRMLYME